MSNLIPARDLTPRDGRARLHFTLVAEALECDSYADFEIYERIRQRVTWRFHYSSASRTIQPLSLIATDSDWLNPEQNYEVAVRGRGAGRLVNAALLISVMHEPHENANHRLPNKRLQPAARAHKSMTRRG